MWPVLGALAFPRRPPHHTSRLTHPLVCPRSQHGSPFFLIAPAHHDIRCDDPVWTQGPRHPPGLSTPGTHTCDTWLASHAQLMLLIFPICRGRGRSTFSHLHCALPQRAPQGSSVPTCGYRHAQLCTECAFGVAGCQNSANQRSVVAATRTLPRSQSEKLFALLGLNLGVVLRGDLLPRQRPCSLKETPCFTSSSLSAPHTPVGQGRGSAPVRYMVFANLMYCLPCASDALHRDLPAVRHRVLAHCPAYQARRDARQYCPSVPP